MAYRSPPAAATSPPASILLHRSAPPPPRAAALARQLPPGVVLHQLPNVQTPVAPLLQLKEAEERLVRSRAKVATMGAILRRHVLPTVARLRNDLQVLRQSIVDGKTDLAVVAQSAALEAAERQVILNRSLRSVAESCERESSTRLRDLELQIQQLASDNEVLYHRAAAAENRADDEIRHIKDAYALRIRTLETQLRAAAVCQRESTGIEQSARSATSSHEATSHVAFGSVSLSPQTAARSSVEPAARDMRQWAAKALQKREDSIHHAHRAVPAAVQRLSRSRSAGGTT